MRAAAFLRGINVAGRRVKGADLCSCFEAAGVSDVAAFRASGNVVFDPGGVPLPRLTRRIEEQLTQSLGWEVAAFLRTGAEVRAIGAHEPFGPAQVRASTGKLQVAFLGSPPTDPAREQVLAMASAEDPLAFGDRELYWLPRGGFLESGLDRDAIARVLGLMTYRTQNTVRELARKYFPV